MAPVPRTCLFRPSTPDKKWFHRGSTMYKAVLEARAKQQALESIVQFTVIVADVSMVSFNKGRINEWVPVRLDVWEGQRSFPTRWEEERKCSHSRLLFPLPLRKHPTRLWIGASLSLLSSGAAWLARLGLGARKQYEKADSFIYCRFTVPVVLCTRVLVAHALAILTTICTVGKYVVFFLVWRIFLLSKTSRTYIFNGMCTPNANVIFPAQVKISHLAWKTRLRQILHSFGNCVAQFASFVLPGANVISQPLQPTKKFHILKFCDRSFTRRMFFMW